MSKRSFCHASPPNHSPNVVPAGSQALPAEPIQLPRDAHLPGSGCCDLDVMIDHETFELIWLAQELLEEAGEPNDIGSVIDRALSALIESFEERPA